MFSLEFLALLEVQLHEFLIDFDDLVDDLSMRFLDGAECGFLTLRLEKTVDDAGAVRRRQVHRQALGSERFLDILKNFLHVDVFGIDLVHDNHAAHALLMGSIHHAAREHLDAGLRIDDDSGRVCRGQHRLGTTVKVAVSRCVDQVYVGSLVIEVTD